MAPGSRDWRFESGPGLHWWCPAAVCSACAACGLPCSPVDTTGSDWRHEKVPQKPNQNALRNSPSKNWPRPEQRWRRWPSREANATRAAPSFHSQGLDARSERTVQNPDAPSHIMKQASSQIPDGHCRLGNHPTDFPVPAVCKNAQMHQRMSLSSNRMREKQGSAHKRAELSALFGWHLRLYTGQTLRSTVFFRSQGQGSGSWAVGLIPLLDRLQYPVNHLPNLARETFRIIEQFSGFQAQGREQYRVVFAIKVGTARNAQKLQVLASPQPPCPSAMLLGTKTKERLIWLVSP